MFLKKTKYISALSSIVPLFVSLGVFAAGNESFNLHLKNHIQKKDVNYYAVSYTGDVVKDTLSDSVHASSEVTKELTGDSIRVAAIRLSSDDAAAFLLNDFIIHPSDKTLDCAKNNENPNYSVTCTKEGNDITIEINEKP